MTASAGKSPARVSTVSLSVKVRPTASVCTNLTPHRFGSLDAAALQLGPRDRPGHAVVVLDALGPRQRPGALGEDGGIHSGPGGIQRGGYARRPGADDHNICHGKASLSVFGFSLV